MYYVGVDVGGTNVKFGLIQDGAIIARKTINTNALDIIRQVVAGVREIVLENGLNMESIAGVGVGFPGMMKNGRVIHSPNILLDDCPIQSILSDQMGVSVVVKNDGDLAAFAEHEMGAGVGTKDMIMLTIGTGVGGGIIINNEIYQGRGGAGELGHILCVPHGKPCNCGRSGCAEKYVSLSALSELITEKMAKYPETSIDTTQGLRAVDILNAYRLGDTCAVEILTEYVETLSNVVLSYCNIFRPDAIIIGGGLTYASEIINMVEKRCAEQHYGYEGSPTVKVLPAKLGNDAGMLGAVLSLKG